MKIGLVYTKKSVMGRTFFHRAFPDPNWGEVEKWKYQEQGSLVGMNMTLWMAMRTTTTWTEFYFIGFLRYLGRNVIFFTFSLP